MNIGIDVDGVIADQAKGVLRIINNVYSTCYTLDMWDSWDYASDIVGGAKTLLQMMEKSWEFGYVTPIEFDVGSIVAKIKKIGVVTIISKRTYKSHVFVVRALQDWKIEYDNLVLMSGNKWEEKLDYPIDVLIDDHPTVNHWTTGFSGIDSRKLILLRDQPWNQDIDCGEYPHITRIFSLAEAIPLLEEYKKIYG